MALSNKTEHEERCMSDLSDWASNVTSASEIQLNNLAIEQDIYNLKRECEEKDAIIKELNTSVQSSNVATLKRVSELEDIIRRKNTIITRLKKDMVVLEQKIVQLTRLQRVPPLPQVQTTGKFHPCWITSSTTWIVPLALPHLIWIPPRRTAHKLRFPKPRKLVSRTVTPL
ncbi:uncharacterized protein LOC120201592 [Hibiscus syriacus]|uniref:uncharacterized protein LOC120201592 n=1 Tax=Hibiscus syriacus TaxID=106335 RepID=UPI001924463C|nr:uncharacterized protein LOC120201592 [Hibiscus syriacus]